MLNKNKIRELAYFVKVDSISPMNADRLECAHVGGWNCVVGKGEFHSGDVAVYFEIDSQVPEVEPFTSMEFLKSKHYKIKSQKIRGVVSQGLLVPVSAFGWSPEACEVEGEGRFLTEKLGVTYAVAEDNARKGRSGDKYKVMAQNYPRIARTRIWRWLYKYDWGKELLYKFFGHKRKKVSAKSFPTHFPYIHVTDEERVENCPWVLQYKEPLIATEKLDGTSSTYILERKLFGRYEFYVLSRNVRQLTPDQKCYHDDNIYWRMAHKYHIEDHLREYLEKNPSLDYVCIQGESVGSVQGNPLKLQEDDFYGYNFIRSDVGRVSSLEGRMMLEYWGMKWVPILSTDWVNPDTMEEMKALADGKSVVNPNVMREGLVFRSDSDNTLSFKNVSNEYLLSKRN